jgi:drug/metabolite transporter (DMT)-like permease
MDVNLIAILLAGISQGLANTIRKHSSTIQHRATSMTTAAMFVNSVLSIPFLFYQFRLPTNVITWFLVMISVVMYALSFTFMFKSFQNIDLSLSTILQRSNIIFVVLIGALLLQEHLSLVGYIGVLLLFCSSVAVMYERRRFTMTPGAWYALLSALFGAIASVLDKKILSDFSPYTYASVNSLLVSCVFLWRKNTIKESIHFVRTFPSHVLSSSMFGVLAFVALLVVLSHSQVSQAVPVYKTISFLVPVILGILIYKEHTKLWQKIVGVVLAIVGIFLLYV